MDSGAQEDFGGLRILSSMILAAGFLSFGRMIRFLTP